MGPQAAFAASKSAAEIRAGLREVGDVLGEPRRLWELPSLNLGDAVNSLNSNVHDWVTEQSENLGLDSTVTNAIGDKIGQVVENQVAQDTGVKDAVDSLQQATGMVEEGYKVSQRGAVGVNQLKGEMQGVATEFEPIKPVFESSSGLFQLLGSRENMGTLVGCVNKLLNTSGLLGSISGALEGVGNIFNKLIGFFKQVLARIGVGRRLSDGRRLFDYMSLLDGLSFESISSTMGFLVTEVKGFAANFGKADSVLSPALKMIGGALDGRRLDIAADSGKYQEALGLIVPTWKKLENSTISMCPTTLEATSNAKSLLCRIKDFVESNGIEGQVSLIVEACDPDPKSAANQLAKAECPKTAYSANLQDDMLDGNTGHVLGYILAAVAGTGALVGGGAVGYKTLCKKKDDALQGLNQDDSEASASA
jgi:hypothetical protein